MRIIISVNSASESSGLPEVGQSVTQYKVFFEDAKVGRKNGHVVSKIRKRNLKVISVSKLTIGLSDGKGLHSSLHHGSFLKQADNFSKLPKVGDTFVDLKDVVKDAIKVG